MPEPRSALLRRLEQEFPRSTVEPIVGDASGRSFHRIRLPTGETRVLMDYGAPFPGGQTDDVQLTEIFRGARLPVARIEAVWGAEGALVLEDLGSRTLEQALAREPDRKRSLYDRAVRLAADIAERGTRALEGSPRASGPALDEARFRFEMDFFLRHFAGGLLGRPTGSDAVREALYELAGQAATTPRRVLCHRDYHSRNLMVRADGSLAMVDLQDARWGPDGYDLASLLRDAYVDLEDGWIDPLIDLYLECLADRTDPAGFRRRFHIVGAQRMIKALGTFGYQAAVLNRPRYLDAIPRTVSRLQRILPLESETRRLHELLTRGGILATPAG